MAVGAIGFFEQGIVRVESFGEEFFGVLPLGGVDVGAEEVEDDNLVLGDVDSCGGGEGEGALVAKRSEGGRGEPEDFFCEAGEIGHLVENVGGDDVTEG